MGAVIFCTCTNPRLLPSAATWLSGQLGMLQTHTSVDLVAACAGFPYGLADAIRILQEVRRPILLVCAEKFSDKVGSVRTSRMIFGDGAAAVVVAPAAAGAPGDVDVLQTWASGPVSQVNSIIWPNVEFGCDITVYGPEVKALVRRYLEQMIAELQSLPHPDGRPGTLIDAIDLIVPHQANKRMVVDLAEQAGIGRDRDVLQHRPGRQHVGREHSAGDPRCGARWRDLDPDPGVHARIRGGRRRRLRGAARGSGRGRRRTDRSAGNGRRIARASPRFLVHRGRSGPGELTGSRRASPAGAVTPRESTGPAPGPCDDRVTLLLGSRGTGGPEGRGVEESGCSQERSPSVTGGCRGIGAAITKSLAEAGAHVAAGYNRGAEAAEALAASLRAEGRSISLHQGNVAEPEACRRAVREVLDRHGRIDFLVNNAGINVDKTVRKMSVEDWHAVLRVNLSGAFYMTKAVLDHMTERRSGRIVNISSVIGQSGNIGQANYAASKSGQFGFTKSLALEVARKGITVNWRRPRVHRDRDGRLGSQGGPSRR